MTDNNWIARTGSVWFASPSGRQSDLAALTICAEGRG